MRMAAREQVRKHEYRRFANFNFVKKTIGVRVEVCPVACVCWFAGRGHDCLAQLLMIPVLGCVAAVVSLIVRRSGLANCS